MITRNTCNMMFIKTNKKPLTFDRQGLQHNEVSMEQLDKAVELINEAKAEIDKNNTGDRNTGNWNTGDRNTGNWNKIGRAHV